MDRSIVGRKEVVLRDEKILITGANGEIGYPMAEFFAKDNEVWGVARFTDPDSRDRVERLGVTTRRVDLASGDFGDLPDDFTYVMHLAVFRTEGDDYDYALANNAEATGLLMAKCRKAKAFLHTSTVAIYDNHPDPHHEYTETDPLGDSRQPYSRTYAISKIAAEAVARTAARIFDLPTTIARINVPYGPNGGWPAMFFDMMRAGQLVPLKGSEPNLFNPICHDDMNEQVGKLLSVASVPATIVNWAGNEQAGCEDWCRYFDELTGIKPKFVYYDEGIHSRAMDNTKRRKLIGNCKVDWKTGMRHMIEQRYPDVEIKI